MNNQNNKFKKGSGTYICDICKKKTRATGYGEEDLGYCAFCYREITLENELMDEYITKKEYDIQWEKLKKEYNK